jgi:phage gpG-like protein
MIKLSITYKGSKLLERMEKRMRPAMREGMKKFVLMAENFAKTKSFGGPGQLQVRTGTLSESINSYYYQTGPWTLGGLYSNVVYARIHELGGTIRPRTAKVLKFRIDGRWYSAKSVVIPARPYLLPAIQKNLETLLGEMADEIVRQLEK